MNHLYEIATGRHESSTVLDIPDVKEGMAVKASDKKGIWSAELLDFVPLPIVRVISKLEFLDKFADAELENIIAEAAKDTARGRKVGVFLKRLDLAESIDLADLRTIAAVNGLESLGLVADAEAVLNG